jgi:uncharacterized membrane protein
MKTTTLISTALTSLIAFGALSSSAQAADEKAATEKCYGIAKAGKNDCAANAHSCAGQSTKDANGKEWVKVPMGTCERIVGGSTSPK